MMEWAFIITIGNSREVEMDQETYTNWLDFKNGVYETLGPGVNEQNLGGHALAYMEIRAGELEEIAREMREITVTQDAGLRQ